MSFPLFSSPPTARELVLDALARVPYRSAEEIRSAISSSGRTFTRQSVFKELKFLLRATAVVKSGRRYALSLAWLEGGIRRLDATAEAHALGLVPHIEPGAGNKARFTFRGLLRLKVFWSHLCLGSLKRSLSRELWSWNPHPWAYLVLSEHERDMMNAIADGGYRMVKIVGGDRPLDRSAARMWQRREIVSHFLTGAFPKDRHRYFSLVDDTLITVTIPKFSAAALDRWYAAHPALSDTALRSLIEILGRAHPATVTVEKGTRLAGSVRDEFDRVLLASRGKKRS